MRAKVVRLPPSSAKTSILRGPSIRKIDHPNHSLDRSAIDLKGRSPRPGRRDTLHRASSQARADRGRDRESPEVLLITD